MNHERKVQQGEGQPEQLAVGTTVPIGDIEHFMEGIYPQCGATTATVAYVIPDLVKVIGIDNTPRSGVAVCDNKKCRTRFITRLMDDGSFRTYEASRQSGPINAGYDGLG